MSSHLLIKVFAAIYIIKSAIAVTCPPPGFDSVQPFNLTAFLANYWYIQRSIPLSYAPSYGNYCGVTHYKLINASNPYDGVVLYNYGNYFTVNGPLVAGSGGPIKSPFLNTTVFQLVAQVQDPPSKWKIQPNFPGPLLGTLLNVLGVPNPIPVYSAPNFWVVATGTAPGKPGYDWAIVTGGPPTFPNNQNGKCAMASPDPITQSMNTLGFWFYTRDPVVPKSLIDHMYQVSSDLGLDTSQLLPVEQQGCTYVGAN
eukprot:jgi/Botrbrau1/6589/Bobra.0189s0016.1